MPIKPVIEELPDGTSIVHCCFDKRITYSRITNVLAPLQSKYKGFSVLALGQKLNATSAPYGGTRVWIRIYIDKERKMSSYTVEQTTSGKIQPEIIPYHRDRSLYPKGTPRPHHGSVPLETIVRVALEKRDELLGQTLSDCVVCILGTCKANGVHISRMPAREIEEQILDGKIQILDNGEILRI